jgi:uncharacterized membrane protein
MRTLGYPFSLLNRIGGTYWFVPSVVTAAAAVSAELLVVVERVYSPETSWLGWTYGGGADGARTLLSAIAGSTITVVSVTFSVLVVALTVSSQHFGPRLLTNFMRDRPAQLVLGTFIGTFAYCLMVLRTVQGDGGDRYTFFVPHIAVSGAVVLTLFSVAALIYYVHHVAVSMQVSEITARVAHDLENAIDRLYPDRLGAAATPHELPPQVPGNALWIAAPASGYIQEVDSNGMLRLAKRHDTVIWLTRRPGDFVIDGMPIAAALPSQDPQALKDSLRRLYIIGTDRTSRQDAAFAVQQLVEVALRALSPAVNEAFTAVTCIDRLGQGLSKLLTRQIPDPVRTDEAQRPRVVAWPRTFAELAESAFDPIAQHGHTNIAVATRLLDTLETLAGDATRPDDRRAIGRLADLVVTAVADHIKIDAHRSALERRRDRIHQRLVSSAA